MRKAGLIGIIHIDLDFSGTDLANGTKVSDYVHPKAPARSKPIPRVLVETAGKKTRSLADVPVRSIHNLGEVSQLAE